MINSACERIKELESELLEKDIAYKTMIEQRDSAVGSLERLQAKYEAVCGELEVAQNEIKTLDNDLIKEVTSRDFWEEKATGLAGEIGEFFGIHFGEHSSHNCPVQAAIDFVYWEKNKDD